MNKKIFIGGVLLSLFSLTASGQKKDYSRHVFSMQAGYGNLLKGTMLLTKDTDAYRSQARDGVAWNTSYCFNFIPNLGIGFLYAGHASEASHAEGVDHLYTHYLAPQFVINLLNSRRALISIHSGLGYLAYRNYSEVFGNDRKVRSSTLGFNIGVKAEYKLTAHWGIGGGCQLISGELDWPKVTYHDETIRIDQTSSLRPLSITGGISYHF